jgi:hypothetical protein
MMRIGTKLYVWTGLMVAMMLAPGLPVAKAAAGQGQDDTSRGCDAKVTPERAVPYVITDSNTLDFNHQELRASPQRLLVLEVDDGAYFGVLFKCTAPTYFDYRITADTEASPGSASSVVGPDSVNVTGQLVTHGVTMRHDSRVLRYRVTATLREGLPRPALGPGESGRGGPAPPPPPPLPGTAAVPTPAPVQLFSVAFDIWVATKPDWRLSVIGGVAVSSLVDTKYAINTSSTGAKTFVESPASTQSKRAADVIALANVYYSRVYARTLNFGAAFGIGTSGTSPRFFFGPSVVFGKYFVFTGGWAVGSVAAPPAGQELGAAPVNGDNTLNSLSRRTIGRPYASIGFTWIDRRDQFAAALAAAASASGGIGSCVTSVTPAAVTIDAAGTTASAPIEIKAGADCTWIATLQSGGTHFKLDKGSGKGDGTIKVTAGAALPEGAGDVLNVVGPPGSTAKQVKLSQPKKQ